MKNNNTFNGLTGSGIMPVKPHIPSRTVYDLAKSGNNGILLYAILDESGSMNIVRDATIEGFNSFVSNQKEVKGVGEGRLTTLKFDAPRLTKLYSNIPLSEVPALTRETYSPNLGTNLNDAIGTAISEINNYLNTIPQESRPAVLVMVMTDGEENSSRMFTAQDVKNLVSSAQDSDWTFSFLGANIDAFAVGSQYGFHAAATASYNVGNMSGTFKGLANMTSTVRSAKAAGVSTNDIYASASMYSAEDRAAMAKDSPDRN